MRRRMGWHVLGLGLVLAVGVGTGQASAGTPPAGQRAYTAGDKLVRGLANIVTGFIEVPRNIHNTTAADSMLAGWTVGLGKGIGWTALRMFVGVYEVITFPFPAPKDYVPVIEPAFVWQAPGPRYK